MSDRVWLDSNVVLYALGASHPERAACAAILDAANRGDLEIHVSGELIQEVVFHRMRIGSKVAAVSFGRVMMRSFAVYPIDNTVLSRHLELISATDIRGRDAIHAATALENGFTEIVSADPDFTSIPGLTVLRPSEFLATRT